MEQRASFKKQTQLGVNH